MIPSAYALVLLALAAYRTWRLLAEDDILDRPRRWLLRLGDWQEGDDAPSGYRQKLGDFISCPWCFGFWIGLAWLAAYWVDDRTLYPAVVFAVSALVAAANAIIGALTE